ncbi:LpqB family beta-propeller domain-containing protein [Zafaria sp. Z1313]|uniref:LpqB family beta-propeller domain-containing protein n=1 Tax=Zafaria sp. Z1313 TaxID=3423202 RepID=UPI003D303D56
MNSSTPRPAAPAARTAAGPGTRAGGHRARGEHRRRTRRLATALAAALALVLAACGAIPVDGPVGTSAPNDAVQDEFQYAFSPPGPAQDASPEQIIEGFYTAGIAPKDDYSTAREFLSPELARNWKATTRTLVYESVPNIVGNVEEGSYTVELAVSASIDEHGIMTRNSPSAIASVQFRLVEVDGQWRIAEAPDGTLVEQGSFSALFAPYPLYFYDSTHTYAIPDYRWYANRQSVAATLVESLLAGPAPYLRNAAVSAFPEGGSLARASVPVDGRRATVDLVESVFLDTTELARQLMQQQLELTLDGVSNIAAVTMTVEQRPVSLGNVSPDFEPAVENPSVPNTQVAIADGALVYYQGNGVVPVGGVEDISGFSPRDPAMAPGGNRYAFLSQDRTRLMTIDDAGRVRTAATGTGLLAPSIDIHGWTWTVDGGDDTKVMAVPADTERDGPVREVAAEWMEGATVTSLRISRDGARAVVTARVDGDAGVFVTGVIRDTDGVPRGFTEPLELGTNIPATQAVWDSATSVIAMQANDEQPVQAERITLAGGNETFQPLLGMTNISAGPGEQRTVYAETPEGVFSRVSNVWKRQDGQARYLSYPG